MIPLVLPLDHDLFDGDVAPLFRVAEYVPFAAPVPLTFDPRADPDAVLLRTDGLQLPVERPARTVYLLTAGQGGLDVRDIAADGEIHFADGRVQPLKWMIGEQAWPAWAGVSGRSADPVAIGVNVGGDLLTASLLTVDVSYPDVPITEITVKKRGGAFQLALLAVTVSDQPPVTVQSIADREPGDWIDFRVMDYPSPWVSAPATVPVTVRDGHLHTGAERVRFWGINLVGEGALPDPAVAEPYARHLARAGFNMARLHHMDTDALLLNPRRGEPGEPLATATMLDRMDRFHAALKAAGLYTWLETWTVRTFATAEGMPAPHGIPVGNKYVSSFWPEYLAAKKAWVRALYDRVNPYTGLRYADDPAIGVIELSNEDSLLVAWSGSALERLPGAHRDRLDVLWNAWLRGRYGDDKKLNQAWNGRTRGGLQLGETLSLDSMQREPSNRQRTELYPTTRAADLVRFYTSLEAAHQAEMARFFRDDLGFTAPIACNTSFGVPVADALLAACDVVDLHIYWDPKPEQTVFQNKSLLADPMYGKVLEKLAWCQDGKPCTVSELNHTWPNQYSQEGPLVWAALATRQDLDAVLWFAWGHGPFDPASDGPIGGLDLQGRINALAQMPAASRLFRGATVEPAIRRYVRWWSPDGLLRDLAESPGLWLDPQVSFRSVLDNVLRTSFAPRPPAAAPAPAPSEPPITWKDGRMVIEGAVEAVIGRGGDTARLRVTTEDFVAASLAWVDDAHALLTVVGRAERAGTLWSTGGPGLLVWGEGPIRLQRLHGTVTVDGPRERWELGRDDTPTRRLRGKTVDLSALESPWVWLGELPT